MFSHHFQRWYFINAMTAYTLHSACWLHDSTKAWFFPWQGKFGERAIERDVHHRSSSQFSVQSAAPITQFPAGYQHGQTFHSSALSPLMWAPLQNIKSLKGQSGDMKIASHIFVWLNIAMRKKHLRHHIENGLFVWSVHKKKIYNSSFIFSQVNLQNRYIYVNLTHKLQFASFLSASLLGERSASYY